MIAISELIPSVLSIVRCEAPCAGPTDRREEDGAGRLKEPPIVIRGEFEKYADRCMNPEVFS